METKIKIQRSSKSCGLVNLNFESQVELLILHILYLYQIPTGQNRPRKIKPGTEPVFRLMRVKQK